MVRRARQIATETGAFWTDQFNDADMLDGYRRLGQELLEQLPQALRHNSVLQLRRYGRVLPGHYWKSGF